MYDGETEKGSIPEVPSNGYIDGTYGLALPSEIETRRESNPRRRGPVFQRTSAMQF